MKSVNYESGESMIVAPSLLSANFAHLSRDIDRLNEAGCKMLHLDIMDGNFVPNISFGSAIVKTLRPLTKMAFDVHLMISDPLKYLTDFARAGADYLTFHYEAVDDPYQVIKAIKTLGIKAGISIKPNLSYGTGTVLAVFGFGACHERRTGIRRSNFHDECCSED